MGHTYAADLSVLLLVKIAHSLLEGGRGNKTRTDFWLKNAVLSEVHMPVLLRVHLVQGCIVLNLHEN